MTSTPQRACPQSPPSGELRACSCNDDGLLNAYPRLMAKNEVVIEAGGVPVTVTNPAKVFFPDTGHTKLDIVNYFLAVGDGALRGVHRRPMVLKRFVNGA